MKIAMIETRCECQARLSAQVDEQGRVSHGTARLGRSSPENAPATGMNAGATQFRVGWLCPLCGRNTLRSFERGGLVYTEASRVAS
jgi:hypothetical protein